MAAVAALECFAFSNSRDTPYLGPLSSGDTVNSRGYVVRKGNGTIYPSIDRSIVLRITSDDGICGWGETYGLVAPAAVAEMIRDIIAPMITGRDPLEAEVIWEDLYDLMRVRGYTGGFYLDALAAVDIALWDLKGKILGRSVSTLLGRRRDTVPVYASGLPAGTLEDRVALATSLVAKGFKAIKIAAVVSHGAIEEEVAALRRALPDTPLMVDLHWKYSGAEALALIQRLEPYGLSFAEAPCKPEDVDGLAWVARGASIPIAAGEEWRTVYDAALRIDRQAVAIVQPEMGHTGLTQFMRIARLAEARHLSVAPHATIGCGIFLGASLQASASIRSLLYHEHQHSLFAMMSEMTHGLRCGADGYVVSDATGIGVSPTQALLDRLTPL